MQVVTNIGLFSLGVILISFVGILWKYKNVDTQARFIWAGIMTGSSISLSICSLIKTIYYIVKWISLR